MLKQCMTPTYTSILIAERQHIGSREIIHEYDIQFNDNVLSFDILPALNSLVEQKWQYLIQNTVYIQPNH